VKIKNKKIIIKRVIHNLINKGKENNKEKERIQSILDNRFEFIISSFSTFSAGEILISIY